MERVEWDDKLLLGVPEIDGQHKKLVDVVNKLHTIVTADTQVYQTQMPTVMKEIEDYIAYHFSFEEKNYMEKYGYMGLKLHKMQHDNFIEEIKKDKEKLSNGNQEAGLQLYEYLAKWVVTHIAKADPAWAAVVKQQS